MNPSFIKTQADKRKVYNDYMASLRQEQQNIQKTANALKQIQLTGSYSSPVQDTRTTTEKYMDTYRLKNELQSSLSELMSPDEARKVIEQFDDNEIQFARTQFPFIVKELKPKFSLGVPARVFLNYVRTLLEKFVRTEGVENVVVDEPSGSLTASFTEIRETRNMLERLQRVINQVQRDIPPRTNSEMVIYTNTLSSISDIVGLLPTDMQLRAIRSADRNTMSVLSDIFGEFERYFPDRQALGDFLYEMAGAIQRRNPTQFYNILSSVYQQTSISPEQRANLRRIQDITPEETPNEVTSNELVVVPKKPKRPKQKVEDEEGDDSYTPEEMERLEKNYQMRKEEIEWEIENNKPTINPTPFQTVLRSLLERGINIPTNKEFEPFFDKEMVQKAIDSDSNTDLEQLNPRQRKIYNRLLKEQGKSNVSSLKEKFETPKNPEKTYDIDRQPLTENQRQAIASIDYPLKREEFIKLTAPKKRAYIAKAIQMEDIPENSTFETNDKDSNTGLNFTTKLTAKGVMSDLPKAEKKGSPRYGVPQLNGIFDKYLASKAPREATQEVDTTSSRGGKKSKSGRGISGKGLSKNRVVNKLEGTHDPKSAYSFAPFGRYVVNTNKLAKGVLSINTKTGKFLPKLKSKTISKALTHIIKEIIKGNEIGNEMTSELTDDEIDTLYNALNECQLLSKLNNSPTSQTLSNTEKELNRFLILKGQILAGQNNAEVVREFKALLLKYMKKGQIPKSEGYDILEELLALGY